MHTYEISYFSYEDSSKFILSHSKSFTQEEFDEIVSNCYVEAYLQHKNTEEFIEHQNYMKENSELYDDNNIERINFDDLIIIVKDILITKFSFVEIKPTIKFNVFGWGTIDKDDWIDESNKNNKLVRDKIKVLTKTK